MTVDHENYYIATIPGQPSGTNVRFKIYACDMVGNWALGGEGSYTVKPLLWPSFVPPPREWSWAPEWLRGLVSRYWWPYILIGSTSILMIMMLKAMLFLKKRGKKRYILKGNQV